MKGMVKDEDEATWFTWGRRSGGLVEVPAEPGVVYDEAWQWLCRGHSGRCGSPRGLLWVREGASTRAHTHKPVETFILLEGSADIRSGGRRRLQPLTRGREHWVASEEVHDIHAGEKGALLFFAFPTYRADWGGITYKFISKRSLASQRSRTKDRLGGQ